MKATALKVGRIRADDGCVDDNRGRAMRAAAVAVAVAAALALTGCSTSSTLPVPVSLPVPAATASGGPARSGLPGATTTPSKTSKPVAIAQVPATPAVPSDPTASKVKAKAKAVRVPAPSTLVAHILRTTSVFSAPDGGRVVASLLATTRTAPTWVPVLSGPTPVAGRVQVRFLNGRVIRTGWVPASTVDIADTQAWVEVEFASKTLTVRQSGKADKTWRLLAVGDAGSRWPTPVGTYWIERFGVPTDPNTVYGPGVSVETSARGTWAAAAIIGVHSWRAAIRPGEASHGCLRAPDTAVNAVAALPLGAPVVIRP